MPDYKEMYHILFREMTKVISTLQKAQQQTEEMYVSDSIADSLVIISPENVPDKNKGAIKEQPLLQG